MCKYLEVITSVVIFIIISCAKEKDIVGTGSEYGKLNIKTDKELYYWLQSEENRIIGIEGELQNRSTKIYYSRVGDYWGQTDLVLFAQNSAGRLEKLDEDDYKWNEIELLGMIIEGSKFIPIEPSKNYTIYAHLYVDNDKYKDETGKYRLRIDYFNSIEEAEEATPFSDYSNIFEIRAK